jgi:prophage regulatory protein
MEAETIEAPSRPVSILRRPQVEKRVGLQRSAIYEGIARGTFPRPVRLGARAVGWVEEEIDDWLQARVTESRCQGAGATTSRAA